MKVPPNMRLKLPGARVGRIALPRRRALRPQLKREPLGGRTMRALTASLLLGLGCSVSAPKSLPAPQAAPKDAGFATYADSQTSCVQRLIAPYVAQARATYPDARRKFAAGLPTGFHFALTTQVHDDSGHFEQVFIRVDSIVNARVFGIINNDIYVVRQYRAYMPYAFTEDALLDWTITDPNGVEVEGNFVGRYFDKFQGRPPC